MSRRIRPRYRGTSLHGPKVSALVPACEPMERRVLLSNAWPAGEEFQVNAHTANAQRNPSVAMSADGSFVAAWSSDGQDGSDLGVYAQRYNAAGVPQGAEFRVNTHTTNTQAVPSVAMDAGGNFVIAWHSVAQDGSGSGVYAQRYSAAGMPQGAEFRVNTYTTNAQNLPSVAMDADGDFVIAWTSWYQAGFMSVYAQRYNASGVPQGGEFRVNTFTTGQQSNPSVAMDTDGDFVIAWHSFGQDGSISGVYARRYSAAGVPQGGEFRVNTHTTERQEGPAVAMSADGDFVIAWRSNLQDGSGYGVYAQRYSASGLPQGGEFRVNTNTAFHQRDPSVAMDAGGNFVIAWHSTGQDGSGYGMYAQRYSGTGEPLGGEFRANTFTTGEQSNASVAMDADGDFVIVWQSFGQDGSGFGVFAQRYRILTAADAATVGDRVWNDLDGNGIQDPGEPGLAGVTIEIYAESGVPVATAVSDVAGNYTFLLPNGELAYLRFVTPAGYIPTRQHQGTDATLDSDADRSTGLTPPFTLANAGDVNDTIDAGFLVPSTISGIVFNDLNGNGVRDPGEQGVAAFELFIDLNLNGVRDPDEPYAMSGNDGFTFEHVLPDMYVLVVVDQDLWSVPAPTSLLVPPSSTVAIERPVRTMVRDSAAVAMGAEFRVNTFTTGNQGLPSTATDAAGNFVIAWTSVAQDGSAWGVYAQRYNAAGVPQGAEFRVNTYTPDFQGRPSVAMDADGDFVIAWESGSYVGGQDGDGWGVFAQRYNAAGVPQGGEFRVNTYTTNNQFAPSVAMDLDGRFLIAWHSVGQDGSDFGVYAQRYNASGVPLGGEFRVNTFTTGEQGNPSVAMDTDGDFIIAWDSGSSSGGQDGDGWGVFAQRYSAAGVPQGAEFRVNTYTTNNQFDPSVAVDADGNFVITWHSIGQDGSGYGVYAQRYNAAGLRQGGEFRVHTFTTSHQRNPSIATSGNGDFVIAWASSGQDGSLFGVYAQRYNAAGVPQGGEFRVNTYTTGHQYSPSVALDADGDLIIAWEDSGRDGSGYGVYAQRYAVVPSVVASGFLFETSPHRLQFRFDRDVSVSLGTDDLLVHNLTTGQTISAVDLVLTYDPKTNTASFGYTGVSSGGLGGVLPDGNYRATLLAGGITTPAGASLAADHAFDFFFLNGDANRDGLVNLADFNRLAANFGQSGPTIDFTKGDFNYDGTVNLADFNILAARFGTVLAAPRAGSAVAFSASRIDSDRLEDELIR